MKKTLTTLLMAMAVMAAALTTACGANGANASETETVIVEKETKVKEILKETFNLVEYEAGGMTMGAEQLAVTGMANGTYVELLSDGTGTVSIMGTANAITWDEGGEMKINGFPVYTFTRIDDSTIVLEQAGVKYTMSSDAQVIKNVENASGAYDDNMEYVDAYEQARAALANNADGTYYLYGYEAGGELYDSFNVGDGRSVLYSDFADTTVKLNDDGTGTLTLSGNETPIDWVEKSAGGDGFASCTVERQADGRIDLCQYGAITYKLTQELRPDLTEIHKKDGIKKDTRSGNGKCGEAGYLSAPRTLMVSIYLDDDRFQWTDSADDIERINTNLEVTKKTAAFFTNECSEYGYDTEFICDWEENPDLKYELYYEGFVDDEETVEHVRDNLSINANKDLQANLPGMIDELVDESELREKYDADNIVYMVFYNNYLDDIFDHSGSMRSWASPTWAGNNNTEFIFIYTRWDNVAVLAHEILHLFGAPDLYSQIGAANDGIPLEYIHHIENEHIPEIMNGAWFYETYFGFTGGISETTGYYVNLTDKKPEFNGLKFKAREKE